MKQSLITVIACFLSVSSIGLAQDRIWTRADGNTVQAEILSASETHVTIKLSNGKNFQILLTDLIAADQTYVDSWLKLNHKANAVRKLEFQQGTKGSSGNYYRDARTRIIFSSSDRNEEGGRFVADANGAGDPIIQTFLAFNKIFGPDATQIPLGAKIKSAKLLVTVMNPGGVPALYPMAVEWDSSRLSFDDAMFNGNTMPGIQPDDKEALSEPKASPPHGRVGEVEIDVTSSVQNWSNGAKNYGWLLTTKSSNAWGAHGLDAQRTIRPKLVVEFEGKAVNAK